MSFDRDLFISYTHIDNLPPMEGKEGWVKRFQFSLATFLSMRIGGKATIWRDDRLAADDVFADEILAQFPKTAIMLSVVSPRYLNSDWCVKEVTEFCKAAEQSCGLRVENKCRLVKIMKSPTDRNSFPHPAMRETLGFQFYELDSEQAPREFDPYFGTDMEQKFLNAVNKLAFELSELLKAVAKAENAPHDHPATVTEAATDAPPKPMVYLAECSYDQREAREALDVELKRHGYKVLPDHELPKDEAAYRAQVAEYLGQCQLSVHLIGGGYGAVLDGPSDKSMVELQNELATEQSREKGLKRIIWIPEGTAPTQQRQIDFINLLQTNADAQFGADVITSREQETMKGAIHAALQKLVKEAATPAPMECNERKMIYLICDQKDIMSTIPVNKLLKAHGYEVEIPVFEGDAAAVRQANQEMLTQACGVLVFYGEGGAPWKASIDSELRKLAGGRDGKMIYTCLAAPETVAKTYLVATEEPNVLNCLPGISEATFQPFLTAVDGKQR